MGELISSYLKGALQLLCTDFRLSTTEESVTLLFIKTMYIGLKHAVNGEC